MINREKYGEYRLKMTTSPWFLPDYCGSGTVIVAFAEGFLADLRGANEFGVIRSREMPRNEGSRVQRATGFARWGNRKMQNENAIR